MNTGHSLFLIWISRSKHRVTQQAASGDEDNGYWHYSRNNGRQKPLCKETQFLLQDGYQQTIPAIM